VGVVVLLDRIGGELHLAREVRDLDDHRTHLATLRHDRGKTIDHGLRHDHRVLDCRIELLEREVLTQTLLEHGRRHALLREQGLISILVEMPIDLQRRDRHDRLLQLAIRRAQRCLLRLDHQHALRDQAVERLRACFGRIEHRCIDACAIGLAHARELLALRVVELTLRDRLTADLGDALGVLAHALIALHAEEHERRHDQDQQEELHQALMRTDEIEHGQSLVKVANGTERE
jgi:hypothetical protein